MSVCASLTLYSLSYYLIFQFRGIQGEVATSVTRSRPRHKGACGIIAWRALTERAEGNLSARMLSYGDYAIPLLSLGLGLAGYWWLAKWRNRVEAFSSFKEAAKAKTANPNSRAAFKALRALLREYGVQKLEDELAAGGLVKDGKLTTGTKPFNRMPHRARNPSLAD